MLGVVVPAGSLCAFALGASRASLAVAPGVQVDDVSATAVDDVWVVGANLRDGRPAILHWDGRALTAAQSPVRAGELLGVSAISSTDVWAVGGSVQGNGPGSRTLVVHWNGAKWSVVASPNPGSGATELTGVRALSDHDVWAVGVQNLSHPHAVVLRWNGSRWSQIRVPPAVSDAVAGGRHQAPSGISALAPTSPNSALAAVTYLFALPPGHGVFFSGKVLRLRRGRWSTSANYVGAPLFAVAAASARDAWAIGYACFRFSCPPFQTATFHWNGRRWSLVRSPSPGDARLDRVVARSSGNVWAAGTCTGSCSVLVLRWNGRRWSRVPSPGSRISRLISISPVSAAEAWAIGATRDGSSTLVHWNGRSWSTF